MTKEDLKKYLSEAIDTMEGEELAAIFPDSNQPSLYAITHELLGLKGEVKKLAQSSLKLNNRIAALVDVTTSEQQKVEEFEQQKDREQQETKILAEKASENLKYLLYQLIDQNDFISRTAENLDELPKLGYLSINDFKTKFAAWQKGYHISIDKWHEFIQLIGLKQIGKVGEVFNPQYHEAVATTQKSSIENNVIVETEVIGYLYQQQLVRPAKVVVNKIN